MGEVRIPSPPPQKKKVSIVWDAFTQTVVCGFLVGVYLTQEKPQGNLGQNCPLNLRLLVRKFHTPYPANRLQNKCEQALTKWKPESLLYVSPVIQLTYGAWKLHCNWSCCRILLVPDTR